MTDREEGMNINRVQQKGLNNKVSVVIFCTKLVKYEYEYKYRKAERYRCLLQRRWRGIKQHVFAACEYRETVD